MQPPSGRWLARMRPLILAMIGCIAVGAAVGLADSFLHYAFPAWIEIVPLGAGLLLALALIPMSVLAIRSYYRERKLGYTTWPTGGR